MIRPTLALLAATAGVSAFAATGPAALYVTARDTDQRLAAAAPLVFTPLAQPAEGNECVFVDPSHPFATVVGIGGAITDAAAETFDQMPKDKQAELLKAYYDPVDGIGYTLARTSIHSSDFSSASYTYVADGDADLKTFDIAHDLQHRIPLLKAAIAAAGGHLTTFASPWSPPAWMKDNHDMLHGGKLLPEYRDAWAKYYVKFVRAYEQQGVPIWGLTVQNEPMATQTWESCLYTAEEERDFVRDHLGPTLQAAGLGGVKLIVWDHNRNLVYQRASAILDDPATARFVWGVGFHWYVNDSFQNVGYVAAAFPDTHLMMTEGCNGPFDPAKLDDWSNGEAYGHSMIADFNHGACGWTDWNILLDEHGGPNHVGNFCFAPVHGDTRTGELHYTPAYYYIGHFSKFVRPGARRIVAAPTIDELKATAFLNPDGSVVVIVQNETDKPEPFRVWIHGEAAPTVSPAHSILTVVVPAASTGA